MAERGIEVDHSTIGSVLDLLINSKWVAQTHND